MISAVLPTDVPEEPIFFPFNTTEKSLLFSFAIKKTLKLY